VVLCTAVVVVLSLHASLRRPFRADLRGPRDAVAPPGALALASLRLALPTAVVAVILGTAASTGLWWLPPALALPVLALCGLSAARTERAWADPEQRSFVVHRVANG
jgi:ABC-type spermidine/putrescine transport system permease subunit II